MGDREVPLQRVAPAGLHDAYLDQIAAAARAFPYVMHVRPWPEMNGDWTSFQPTPAGEKEHGGTPEEFVAAWRYLVTYLRDRGATNLRWVFDPDGEATATSARQRGQRERPPTI